MKNVVSVKQIFYFDLVWLKLHVTERVYVEWRAMCEAFAHTT
jgi:hypothetical protein